MCSTSSLSKSLLPYAKIYFQFQYRRGSERLLDVYKEDTGSESMEDPDNDLHNINQRLIPLLVSCNCFWFHFGIIIICPLCIIPRKNIFLL